MKAQPDRHVEAARRQLRVHAWRAEEIAGAFAELARRRTRLQAGRTRTRWLGGSALAVAASVLLTLGLLGKFETQGPSADGVAVQAFAKRIALGESTEVRFDPGVELDVVERTDARVTVRVEKGTAQFQVRHEPARLFRVEAGDVLVEDIGTVFTVQRRDGVVDVAVSEGWVAVVFTAGESRRRVTLAAGQRGSYVIVNAHARTTAELQPESEAAVDSRVEHSALQAATATAHRVTTEGAAPAPEPSGSSPSDLGSGVGWRALARAGDHQAAYAWLVKRHFEDVGHTPGDLMLAADVARRARHPADAVPLLQKLLANHPRDARAPSAAFTLGWVLMSDLGRPREAGAAFERALVFAPDGNLAQDASARAVEAWQRAGDAVKARRQLEQHRKRYPNGRHMERLERLVESP
jgi:TolA-binding protein